MVIDHANCQLFSCFVRWLSIVGWFLVVLLVVCSVGWLVGSEREARIHRGQDANCQLFGWFLVVLLVAGWLLAV